VVVPATDRTVTGLLFSARLRTLWEMDAVAVMILPSCFAPVP